MVGKRIKKFFSTFTATTVLAVCLIFGNGLTVQAADINSAYLALQQGDYELAVQIFKELSDAGDMRAQYEMGYLYSVGLGVAKDWKKASAFYTQAARAGYAPAQASLAYNYSFGLGVPLDKQTAEYWNEQAAAAGNLMAMNNLVFAWVDSDRNLEKALGMIMQVLEEEPNEAAYLDTYGWVLYKMGRYKEAISPVCQAALNEPGSPEIRLHLGDIYWRNGLKEKAATEWRTASELTDTGQFLSESGQHFVGALKLEEWNALITIRLKEGLEGPVADPNELPPDFLKSNCLRPIS